MTDIPNRESITRSIWDVPSSVSIVTLLREKWTVLPRNAHRESAPDASHRDCAHTVDVRDVRDVRGTVDFWFMEGLHSGTRGHRVGA